MRHEYYKVYENLGAQYGRFPWRELLRSRRNAQDTKLVQGLIEDALRLLPSGLSVRPDASYFLLVNLHQMVLLPLQSRGVSSTDIRQALANDAREIIANAARAAREEGRSEVTGGGILRAVASLWNTLQLNRLEFWG